MKINLKENERIDDLEYKNLKIIQDKTGFCFGIDSILLSDFSKKLKKNSIVADLGMGNGVISVLLSKKAQCKKIYGIEIQKEVAGMAQKTVNLNNLNEIIEVINDDIKNISNIFGKNYFDAIITNPPYKKVGSGIENDDKKKLISRHEILCDLEDIVNQSSKVLKDKGEFYMVHRPDRLPDILYLMRNYKIEPKVLRIVYSNTKSKATLVLIKGIKNAGKELKIEAPLYIYNENGTYTEEILEIYNKKR